VSGDTHFSHAAAATSRQPFRYARAAIRRCGRSPDFSGDCRTVTGAFRAARQPPQPGAFLGNSGSGPAQQRPPSTAIAHRNRSLSTPLCFA
jgi:hypothetical protein